MKTIKIILVAGMALLLSFAVLGNVGRSERRSQRVSTMKQLGLMFCALVVVGCSDPSTDAVTDKWVGQWNGPEGTFLRLEGGQGKYEITIQNLDGPRTFQGSAVGAQVQFERDGLTETIHATDGRETGMKWLSDKSDCLTIRPGEGYCRD